MLESDLTAHDHEDDVILHVARALRRSEDLGPAVDRAVMATLRAAPVSVVAGGAVRDRAAVRRERGAARACPR